MRMLARVAVLAAAALMAGGADRPAPGAATRDWNTAVSEAEGGHRIGNPQAALTVTEFVSYTCPHCAAFVREGEPALKLAYVRPGRVRLEIRHLLRDPVDITAALLARCGPAVRFPQNHAALMLAQPRWLPALGQVTEAQRARWTTGTGPARRRAIAADAGFYSIMERRGYSRVEADRCLNDEAAAQRLAEISAADWKRPGIGGTPSFAIDGTVLAGTHSWTELQPQLAARF